jgi:hypothetical protein
VYNRGEGVIFKPRTPALTSANSVVSGSMQAYRNLGNYYYYYLLFIIVVFIILRNVRNFLTVGVCPSNEHCPSAQCACAANAVSKDLDIFAVREVSLNHNYTHGPKIVKNMCS